MTQTIFITGASSGIGKASAILFASKGWNVIATMRDPSKETELTQIDNVLVTRLDVQDHSSIDAAFNAAIDRFGHVDLLCNNAGYGQNGVFEAVPQEKIKEQFDVNVFGVMDVIRKFLPHFRANKRGFIINISSGGGIYALPMMSIYCSSKFALEGFTEALSYELASQNITVKLVIPHGGVSKTSFGTRANQDMAGNAAIKDYEPFVARTMQAIGKMAASIPQTSEDIANKIYEAATDATDRLRYLVGVDTRGFIKAKTEMSDEAYVQFMRKAFSA